MRLSQTVLTALVATSATALPVTDKQPAGEQQQQQVSPDHDRVQAQKFGKLDETAHKQPIGYNNDKEVNTEKKNTGTFNGLFTTNGQKESQGWAKIKSALSRGNGKQDEKLDSRKPNKGEFTEGNRQHGSNGVIQARHDSNEDVRLEKMIERPSRLDSGNMGRLGHDQYLEKSSDRPYRGEYIAPREIKRTGGNMVKDDMPMNMETTMPSQEREEWMRDGRTNDEWMRGSHGSDEWMRHGEESDISKSRGQDKYLGMNNKYESDRRQGQYKDEFVSGQYREELVKGQKETRTFSPMTQSWIVRFNNDASKDGKVMPLSNEEQIAGTIQMTYVDDRTPEQQHREVPNSVIKERMMPNRVPHTYEPEMRKPWNQEDERQYNEYLNKGNSMTGEREYHDRQPSSGETKQFLSFQPNTETKKILETQPSKEHGVNFSSEPNNGEVKEFLNYQPISGEKQFRDRQPVNGETKEFLNYQPISGEKQFRDRQPMNGETKEFLSYQPISGEKQFRDRQPVNGETKEFLNYQPISGEKQFRDRQPMNGETKEFLSYQPISGEKQFRDRQPMSGETKEFLNYQPISGEKQFRDRQPMSGETKEFLNYQPVSGETKEHLVYQPTSGETKQYRDRQPINGEETKEFNHQPINGETKNVQGQSGRTQMDLNNQPSDGMHHTTNNQFQTMPQQSNDYRVISPNHGTIQRRNRHLGNTQNSQVSSEEMSRDRVPVDNNVESTRPHTWMVTDPSILGDDFLEPTTTGEKNMMVKAGKVMEARELLTNEHGRDEPMHKESNLNCDAEGGFQCVSTVVKDKVMPFETVEMMKEQVNGKTMAGVVEAQRQPHEKENSFMEHNPIKGTTLNN